MIGASHPQPLPFDLTKEGLQPWVEAKLALRFKFTGVSHEAYEMVYCTNSGTVFVSNEG